MCVEALMIGGALLSGAGQIMTGVENSKAAKMQAQMARQNADLALAQGAYQEQEIRRDVAGVLGGQQSYFASSGLDPTVGSPVVLAANTAAVGEVDALLTRYGAVRDATTYRVDAANYDRQAKQAMMSGIFGAATTMLNAGASLYQWQGLHATPSTGKAVGGTFRLPGASYGTPSFDTTNPLRIS
ncbi:hypothetical protein [Pleomorphomonas koreensis]|uniref:hypothetical protein n=1 Tax=Pleomorphomonas koreensis TaxID=257440 RepID=UPI00041AF46D|nr:hypothetical protein [Pleomorphomonas koreensis]